MLNNNQKQQIKTWALQEAPLEICGLIYSNSKEKIIDIIKCKNIASNKENYFEIDPLSYLKISNNKENKILGIFHSQKEGEPTPIDYINSKGHNYYSIVYSRNNDEFYEIDKFIFPYKKYLYKPFIMGSDDCLGLIIFFYKNEYNIKITNFIRDEKWFEKNPNLIKDNIKKEGFIEIENYEKIKNGDIIVFSYKHMGIYLEKDLLLHTPYGFKSKIERINNSMKSRIDTIIRHKNNL